MSVYQSLFSSSTVPLLAQVVDFSQQRHGLLAGNIANIDTPGYQARDLSVDGFQAQLRETVAQRDRPAYASPGPPPSVRHGGAGLDRPETILRHDLANVSMEDQVSEMVKNQIQHNLALTLMVSQFRQLQTAISERV